MAPRTVSLLAAKNANKPCVLSSIWVGADVLKVLAGPALADLAFSVQNAQKQLVPQATEAAGVAALDPLAAHEDAAMKLLKEQQPVAALAELEIALCLAEKHSIGPTAGLPGRWEQLAASAVSWSLDMIADAAQASDVDGLGGEDESLEEALEMLCLAEMVTRKEVAETFNSADATSRPFIRAVAHAGIGMYYRLRHKPRAALFYSREAASGNARWAHPAMLLNLSSSFMAVRDFKGALEALNAATLALRSSTGLLYTGSHQSWAEVESSIEAARTAVLVVLHDSRGETARVHSASIASSSSSSTKAMGKGTADPASETSQEYFLDQQAGRFDENAGTPRVVPGHNLSVHSTESSYDDQEYRSRPSGDDTGNPSSDYMRSQPVESRVGGRADRPKSAARGGERRGERPATATSFSSCGSEGLFGEDVLAQLNDEEGSQTFACHNVWTSDPTNTSRDVDDELDNGFTWLNGRVVRIADKVQSSAAGYSGRGNWGGQNVGGSAAKSSRVTRGTGGCGHGKNGTNDNVSNVILSRPTSACGGGASGAASLRNRAASGTALKPDTTVEITSVRSLLMSTVMLRPWPEFRETSVEGAGNTLGKGVPDARIAHHATHLKKCWPLWGRAKRVSEAPGAGLVLRESLLLCFINAAALLSQLYSPTAYAETVLPILREGLIIALVLFGAQHPLALKIVNSFQKASRALQPPPPPAAPSTKRASKRNLWGAPPSRPSSAPPGVPRAGLKTPFVVEPGTPRRRPMTPVAHVASPRAADAATTHCWQQNEFIFGDHVAQKRVSTQTPAEILKSNARAQSARAQSKRSSGSHVQDFFTAQRHCGHGAQRRVVPTPMEKGADPKLHRPLLEEKAAELPRPTSAPGAATRRRTAGYARANAPPPLAAPKQPKQPPQPKHRARPVSALFKPPRSPRLVSPVLGKAQTS